MECLSILGYFNKLLRTCFLLMCLWRHLLILYKIQSYVSSVWLFCCSTDRVACLLSLRWVGVWSHPHSHWGQLWAGFLCVQGWASVTQCGQETRDLSSGSVTAGRCDVRKGPME